MSFSFTISRHLLFYLKYKCCLNKVRRIFIFSSNIIIIYFFYGLKLLYLSISVLLEAYNTRSVLYIFVENNTHT